MELPVLPTNPDQNTESIIRAIKKANAETCAQSAIRTDLDSATALIATDLPDIWDANIAFDIHLPENMTPQGVYEEITNHYTNNNAKCITWVPNDLECDQKLASLFNSETFECEYSLCMILTRAQTPRSLRDDLQIIPARAMRREYANLHRIAHAHQWGESSADQMAQFQLNTLDSPQLDAFIARLNKQVVAAAGIYSLGEIGIIYEVITHPDHRKKGIMKSLLHHILRHAARCQFKTIALETTPDNIPAINLYQSFGFEKLTEFPAYRHISNKKNTSTP